MASIYRQICDAWSYLNVTAQMHYNKVGKKVEKRRETPQSGTILGSVPTARTAPTKVAMETEDSPQCTRAVRDWKLHPGLDV